jgi:hypothetical protein
MDSVRIKTQTSSRLGSGASFDQMRTRRFESPSAEDGACSLWVALMAVDESEKGGIS